MSREIKFRIGISSEKFAFRICSEVESVSQADCY